MINENIVRRVDGLGRVVIPKHLRNKVGINDGDELEIFTEEIAGRVFICFSKVVGEERKREEARRLLEELGIEVPLPLLES